MPRNPNNPNERIAGQLPIITCGGKKYFVDGLLKEARNVDDPHDKWDDHDEAWETMSKEDQNKVTYEFYGSIIHVTKYVATDIKYDTDGKEVDLPKELIIDIPDDVEGYEATEQYISDEISNKTGFCHFGFSTTPEIKQEIE